MYLGWPDVNLRLRTIRVTAKPKLGFFPKRWEERKVPKPVRLTNILDRHPQTSGSVFMFPSPTGNREQNMLRLCKAVAERAGPDPAAFDLKTFRSNADAASGFRHKDCSRLDGAQVPGDHDALPGSRNRCA